MDKNIQIPGNNNNLNFKIPRPSAPPLLKGERLRQEPPFIKGGEGGFNKKILPDYY